LHLLQQTDGQNISLEVNGCQDQRWNLPDGKLLP